MKKPDLNEILKKAAALKNRATEIGKGAGKAASVVKGAVTVGVLTSKAAAEKAKGIMTPENISKGLEATSKGMDIAAKGAKKVANSMDKASQEVRKLGEKIRRDRS